MKSEKVELECTSIISHQKDVGRSLCVCVCVCVYKWIDVDLHYKYLLTVSFFLLSSFFNTF